MLFAFALSEFHIKRATPTMLRVGGLKAHNVGAKNGFMKHQRHFAAQLSLALWRVEMAVTVQRVACIRRCTFARNHQNQTHTAMALDADEV